MTPGRLKYFKASVLGLTTTSEKDAYKQFGTVWMLACTGKHYYAGIVLGVVIAPWSSN